MSPVDRREPGWLVRFPEGTRGSGVGGSQWVPERMVDGESWGLVPQMLNQEQWMRKQEVVG